MEKDVSQAVYLQIDSEVQVALISSNYCNLAIPAADNLEVIHQITTTSTGNFTASLSFTSIRGTLAIISDCNDPENSCIEAVAVNGASASVIAENLPAGTYFIVYDTRVSVGPATTTYSLTVTCPATQQSGIATDRNEETYFNFPDIKKDQLNLKIQPNPFNTVATITYTMPRSGQTEIALRNMSGQVIEQVLLNQWQEKGTHQLDLNQKNFPAGIYYLVMRTEGLYLTEKVVLLNN